MMLVLLCTVSLYPVPRKECGAGAVMYRGSITLSCALWSLVAGETCFIVMFLLFRKGCSYQI